VRARFPLTGRRRPANGNLFYERESLFFVMRKGATATSMSVEDHMKVENRFASADSRRIALTILVTAHHVGQACGITIGSWGVQGVVGGALLAPFFTTNRSLLMSLFLMVSGCFMVLAYEQSGARAFLRNRLVRLGVPFLVSMLVAIPLRMLLFGERIARWHDLVSLGHLRYIQHLLLFSLGYAAWRWIRRNRPATGKATERLPGTLAILLCAVALAAVSVATHFWAPSDARLTGFLAGAFADIPRDLGLFAIGAVVLPRAWKTQDLRGWLSRHLAPDFGQRLTGRPSAVKFPRHDQTRDFAEAPGSVVQAAVGAGRVLSAL